MPAQAGIHDFSVSVAKLLDPGVTKKDVDAGLRRHDARFRREMRA